MKIESETKSRPSVAAFLSLIGQAAIFAQRHNIDKQNGSPLATSDTPIYNQALRCGSGKSAEMGNYATYVPTLGAIHGGTAGDHTPPAQRPTIFWIGCCDARASEAKALPGKEVFVHRNIANQFQFTDSNAIACLAYAVSLSTMEEIRVVGHTDCGGIHACYDAAHGRAPPLHWALWNWLESLSVIAKAHPQLTVLQLTELNVRLQVRNVRAVLEKLTNRPLRVGGYVYDLADNRLDPVL